MIKGERIINHFYLTFHSSIICTYIRTFICTKEFTMTTLPNVKATNVTTFRNTIKKQLDLVTKENISLIVTRNDDKNVVVLSETEYEQLIKTINNLQYENKILHGMVEIQNGGGITMDLNDLLINEE